MKQVVECLQNRYTCLILMLQCLCPFQEFHFPLRDPDVGGTSQSTASSSPPPLKVARGSSTLRQGMRDPARYMDTDYTESVSLP